MAVICGKPVDVVCILTAICFFLSHILNIILRAAEFQGAKNGDYDYYNFLQLDTQYLQQQWERRLQHQGLRTFSNLFGALAWFLFCLPTLQVSWILSRGGKRRLSLHVTLTLMVVGGSLTELISRLMSVGMNNITLYLASDFNLNNWVDDTSNDGIGWKTLEVTSMLANGMMLWIDALEWLALFSVLVLIYVSLKTERINDATLSSSWACLGLVIGLLCFFDFAAELMRSIDFMTFATISIAISTINTLLLLPIWLVWLGFQLAPAKIPYDEDLAYEVVHELELTLQQQQRRRRSGDQVL